RRRPRRVPWLVRTLEPVYRPAAAVYLLRLPVGCGRLARRGLPRSAHAGADRRDHLRDLSLRPTGGTGEVGRAALQGPFRSGWPTAAGRPSGGLLRYEHRIASSKLREAVADGPILFRGLQNVHEHILRPDAGAFAEQLRGSAEQRLFLLHGAGAEHGDLDEHEIVAAGDAKGSAVAEVRSIMLRDGHELVAFRYAERFAHRAVKAVEDGLSVGFRLSGAQ